MMIRGQRTEDRGQNQESIIGQKPEVRSQIKGVAL